MIKNQNIVMVAGDTKNIEVTVTTAEHAVANISGATIRWAIKKAVDSVTNELLKSTVENGIQITNGANGIFVIKILNIDTINFKGKYYHEGKLTDVDGNVSTLFSGNITIEKSGIQ